jgi:hypothetical protein
MKQSARIFSLVFIYWSLMPDVLIASKHPIYDSILAINPKVDTELAMELSNYLSRYSKKYGTNPYRSVAIIAQESMFRNISTDKDIGIFQFNLGTIKIYKMDKLRLQFDLEYATHEHVKLLAKKKEYCKDKEESWACYHSSAPRHYSNYVKLVNRYYNQIVKGE